MELLKQYIGDSKMSTQKDSLIKPVNILKYTECINGGKNNIFTRKTLQRFSKHNNISFGTNKQPDDQSDIDEDEHYEMYQDDFELEAHRRNSKLVLKYKSIPSYCLWTAYDIRKESN